MRAIFRNSLYDCGILVNFKCFHDNRFEILRFWLIGKNQQDSVNSFTNSCHSFGVRTVQRNANRSRKMLKNAPTLAITVSMQPRTSPPKFLWNRGYRMGVAQGHLRCLWGSSFFALWIRHPRSFQYDSTTTEYGSWKMLLKSWKYNDSSNHAYVRTNRLSEKVDDDGELPMDLLTAKDDILWYLFLAASLVSFCRATRSDSLTIV